jgi:hypothetical protein
VGRVEAEVGVEEGWEVVGLAFLKLQDTCKWLQMSNVVKSRLGCWVQPRSHTQGARVCTAA